MENTRGSLLMVAAMAAFAMEDMLIKMMAATLPAGEVVALIGVLGTLLFGALALARGQRVWSPALLSRPVMLRNVGEIIGTAGFVSAVVLTTLSSASAILQALPLAVTLGAALFLGEPVGWRRWLAIGAGLAGVLLVIQPGLAGFAPASLFAVAAVAALALRDISVRKIRAEVTSGQLAVWGFAAVIVAGVLMMLVRGTAPVQPSPLDLALLAATSIASVLGYYALVGATRTGDVSVVVPYRYIRLVFAMALGAIAFGERPDPLTLTGAALIVGAGMYTMWRETRGRSRVVSEGVG